MRRRTPGGARADRRGGGAAAEDELHQPLARLCEAIERQLRTRVQANLYASWTSTEGFGVHWDDHDTVIV
ncbi:cupin domain-containing protein [Streptomyces europaeiscabiei]|uniref:JmjC domain-containing protein n=1 Tax=Streptomyces europaeiscabiei TaxID=146819 RepID=UPI0029AFEA76|nr:cupin domain-containing protein [Streptomyces europaeiscabiei]